MIFKISPANNFFQALAMHCAQTQFTQMQFTQCYWYKNICAKDETILPLDTVLSKYDFVEFRIEVKRYTKQLSNTTHKIRLTIIYNIHVVRYVLTTTWIIILLEASASQYIYCASSAIWSGTKDQWHSVQWYFGYIWRLIPNIPTFFEKRNYDHRCVPL